MFQQSLRTIPQVNPNFWSFAITGAVSRPLILSYADLQAFPTHTARVAVVCGGKNADRPLFGEALWRGVPLAALLDEVTIAPAARFAHIHAADGYTTVLPLERLAQTLLAYEMDGALLPPEHGCPARLIAPGLYGYKMPKWIERVELTDSPEGGFWEARGGSLDGVADLRVAIDDHMISESAPTVITLRGTAPNIGHIVDTLQISIDGGGWMPIPFTPAEPFALTHWQIDWTPPGAGGSPVPGDYHVRVRAAQGASSAEHSLVVKVR